MIFSSPANKVKAEKFRGQILQAFESTLHSELILEIRCESRKDMSHISPDMVACEDVSLMTLRHRSVANQRPYYSGPENLIRRFAKENIQGIGSSHARQIETDVKNGEITEIASSPEAHGINGLTDHALEQKEEGREKILLGEASSSQHHGKLASPHNRESQEKRRTQSLVRGRVSLAHVIQQAEGCAQQSGWSKRKAISIAEKLEQENL